MLKSTGVATQDLIQGVCPNQERRKKGAFAVMECFQKIPCNPCKSSCPKGAIIMEDINDTPKVDYEKCNGCGVCASNCPGLAIFIIDENFSETEALVKLPYEFLPLPDKGDEVTGTDREGKEVCKAVVHNVINVKANDRTPSVWLRVPKRHSMDVRFFTQKNEGKKACDCDCVPVKNIEIAGDNEYVCRCEEITVADIKRYISQGYASLNEIKIISRAGMGACQGRTCRQLIMNIMAAETGVKPENQPVSTFRPPVKPIKMALLCDVEDEEGRK